MKILQYTFIFHRSTLRRLPKSNVNHSVFIKFWESPGWSYKNRQEKTEYNYKFNTLQTSFLMIKYHLSSGSGGMADALDSGSSGSLSCESSSLFFRIADESRETLLNLRFLVFLCLIIPSIFRKNFIHPQRPRSTLPSEISRLLIVS